MQTSTLRSGFYYSDNRTFDRWLPVNRKPDAKDLFLNMDALILRLRELGIVDPLMAA